LISELSSLLNWQPDYEECGIQFGPGSTEIYEVFDEIYKIDKTMSGPFLQSTRLLECVKRHGTRPQIQLVQDYIDRNERLPEYWITKERQRIAIKDMDDNHIKNSHRMIESREGSSHPLTKALRREIRNRGV